MGDEDAFNHHNVAQREPLSWQEVLTEFKEANERLLTLAANLTDTDWDDLRVSGWLQGSTINHYHIHRADFEKAV
jgi:hypothetical protein